MSTDSRFTAIFGKTYNLAGTGLPGDETQQQRLRSGFYGNRIRLLLQRPDHSHSTDQPCVPREYMEALRSQ